ncbi:MAG: L,D-transpeptidase family protein [Prosthecobacter sp.]
MKPRTRTLLLVAALIASCVLVARADSLGVVGSWIKIAMQMLTRSHLPLPYTAPPPGDKWQTMGAAERLASVRSRLLPKLHEELAGRGLKLGQPVYVRIFKESRELELWMKTGSDGWKLFRNYPVACFSGTLGPKTREGDFQAPEGFYDVVKKRLNPTSSYHLSFNIGYPNEHDRHHKHTGGLIMVHGNQVSVGCFAMTDPLIEEIYLVVEAALKSDTASVPVHSFPFRMTPERMQKAGAENSPHLDFWRSLRAAYDHFENAHEVPHVSMRHGHYELQP